jgi:tRNA(Ile)-lysidine synthase TilS/MesJ
MTRSNLGLLVSLRLMLLMPSDLTKPGLAISGGVDSMALAVLCSKLQEFPYKKHKVRPIELQHFRNISFKAFIVDHQVRSGSYEEAKAVSSVLEKRGIFFISSEFQMLIVYTRHIV